MGKFKNKVAMLVTINQFNELGLKLEAMGYVLGANSHLREGDKQCVISNCWDGSEGMYYSQYMEDFMYFEAKHIVRLMEYNPELFLALCAQSPEGQSSFNVGELVQVHGMKGTYTVKSQTGNILTLEHPLPYMSFTVNLYSQDLTIGRPDVETLKKIFARKKAKSEKVVAIENEIKHLRASDHLNSIGINISGRVPVIVHREHAKEAASAAFTATTDVDFAKDFEEVLALKKRPKRKAKTFSGDIPSMRDVGSSFTMGNIWGAEAGLFAGMIAKKLEKDSLMEEVADALAEVGKKLVKDGFESASCHVYLAALEIRKSERTRKREVITKRLNHIDMAPMASDGTSAKKPCDGGIKSCGFVKKDNIRPADNTPSARLDRIEKALERLIANSEKTGG